MKEKLLQDKLISNLNHQQTFLLRETFWRFPCGPVVRLPVQGTGLNPWSGKVHATGNQGPRATATEAMRLEPTLHREMPGGEDSTHAARGEPAGGLKNQHSQNKEENKSKTKPFTLNRILNYFPATRCQWSGKVRVDEGRDSTKLEWDGYSLLFFKYISQNMMKRASI